MPRVPFATYCQRRTKLQQAWQAGHRNFLGLSPKEQWTLHEYYRFTESLTVKQLHQYWMQKRAEHSSLVQTAGRAYAAFEQVTANAALLATQSTSGTKRKRGITPKVDSIVRPQPDTRKTAKVLLGIVQQKPK